MSTYCSETSKVKMNDRNDPDKRRKCFTASHPHLPVGKQCCLWLLSHGPMYQYLQLLVRIQTFTPRDRYRFGKFENPARPLPALSRTQIDLEPPKPSDVTDIRLIGESVCHSLGYLGLARHGHIYDGQWFCISIEHVSNLLGGHGKSPS